MLNINDLENKNKTSAFAHFSLVCIIVNSDGVFLVIFCYLIGVDAIAKLCRMIMFQI